MKSNQLRKSILWGVSIGFSIALAFVVGFLTQDFVNVSVGASPLIPVENYELLEEVQRLLDANYLGDQPDYKEREYAAIRGMLSSLDDPYTFFIDPPVAQSESDVLAGTYGGIGVQVQRSEDGELILFPFDESPAARAGIQDGDVLLAINNESVDFTVRQDVIDQSLRGEVRDGNGVDIRFKRGNEEFARFIEFDVINVPSVVSRVLDAHSEIGYAQILRFTNRTPSELEQAIRDLLDASIEGIIVDLRDNSGGLLQESIDVADIFLDGGVVAYELDSSGERAFTANNGTIANDLPLVMLVNGGTASAAELVAGAIRDRGRGILIGQPTFGKGTVQQIFPLSDGSSVHITSAEWFTPSRNEINGSGLEPDIIMIPDENGRDVELGEAVRYLLEQLEAQ